MGTVVEFRPVAKRVPTGLPVLEAPGWRLVHPRQPLEPAALPEPRNPDILAELATLPTPSS